jgi:FixJ family two-component response regulator
MVAEEEDESLQLYEIGSATLGVLQLHIHVMRDLKALDDFAISSQYNRSQSRCRTVREPSIFRGLWIIAHPAIRCSPRRWMMPSNEMVYIVDDEASVREALSALLRANGKQVKIFTSGQEFLYFPRRDSCACLILDLRMPGMDGLQVQQLIAAQTAIPVIFITGRGDIPSTVTAMKGGAMDFLTKPIDESALLASIERGLELDRKLRRVAFEQESLRARYRLLTPREQQVLPLLVSGLLNKQAAGELGITEYTVQIHRGHIMRKMEADSFATLVKLASKLNLEASEAS